MKTDYITTYNEAALKFAEHTRQVIAMKQAEIDRLEKTANVVTAMADVEAWIADPEVAGDKEKLPSVVRPVVVKGGQS